MYKNSLLEAIFKKKKRDPIYSLNQIFAIGPIYNLNLEKLEFPHNCRVMSIGKNFVLFTVVDMFANPIKPNMSGELTFDKKKGIWLLSTINGINKNYYLYSPYECTNVIYNDEGIPFSSPQDPRRYYESKDETHIRKGLVAAVTLQGIWNPRPYVVTNIDSEGTVHLEPIGDKRNDDKKHITDKDGYKIEYGSTEDDSILWWWFE